MYPSPLANSIEELPTFASSSGKILIVKADMRFQLSKSTCRVNRAKYDQEAHAMLSHAQVSAAR